MKKIKLGTFYGFNVFIEVDEEESSKNWGILWENWLHNAKQNAIQEYKDEQSLNQIKKPKKTFLDMFNIRN